MEMYKTLNRQLVEQVQEMRNTLSEYRDEILYLRAKNLEERSRTANLRRRCVDMAKEHCRQYLDFLEPNSTVLTYLSNELGAERTSSSNRRASQSSRLAEEARRSSSVIQTRRSFNSVSPLRSATNEGDDDGDDDDVEVIENHVGTPPILQGGIIEEVEDGDEAQEYRIQRNYDNSCPNSMQDTAAATQSQSVNGSATENGVQHDDESEEDDDNENEDDEEEEEEEIRTRSHRTLRDVTNTVLTNSADESSQSLNTSKKRVGRPPKSSKVVASAENVNCGRRAKNMLPTRSNTEVQRDKSVRSATSFDEVRHSSRLQQDENSFHFTSHDGSLITTASSFTMTDITMDQFRVENSSTPHNKTSPTSKMARPTRKCKPTSLAERTLSSKLRNESSEQSLGGNNKSRTKKK